MGPNSSALTLTKNAYFSLFIHTKQLLSVTLYDTTAEIENSEVGRYPAAAADQVWIDRREGWNSYVDEF